MTYQNNLKTEEKKLIKLFLIYAIFSSIISPISWIFFHSFPLPRLPEPWNLVFRLDSIYFYMIIIFSLILSIRYFRLNEFSLAKFITVIFYSFPLVSDSTIQFFTRSWDYSEFHEFILFGWQPTIMIYMYMALLSTLISLTFIYFDRWWQLMLTWTYVWNLWGARPFIYLILENTRLVAIMINILITIGILALSLIIKNFEESMIKNNDKNFYSELIKKEYNISLNNIIDNYIKSYNEEIELKNSWELTEESELISRNS